MIKMVRISLASHPTTGELSRQDDNRSARQITENLRLFGIDGDFRAFLMARRSFIDRKNSSMGVYWLSLDSEGIRVSVYGKDWMDAYLIWEEGIEPLDTYKRISAVRFSKRSELGNITDIVQGAASFLSAILEIAAEVGLVFDEEVRIMMIDAGTAAFPTYEVHMRNNSLFRKVERPGLKGMYTFSDHFWLEVGGYTTILREESDLRNKIHMSLWLIMRQFIKELKPREREWQATEVMLGTFNDPILKAQDKVLKAQTALEQAIAELSDLSRQKGKVEQQIGEIRRDIDFHRGLVRHKVIANQYRAYSEFLDLIKGGMTPQESAEACGLEIVGDIEDEDFAD